MNGGSHPFALPREPSLSWKYLSSDMHRSPQDGILAGAGQYFFFWARNALYHALHALEVPRGARALLPAYLCRAAAEPFAAFGLQCDFYDIKRDCTPDFSEIEARLHSETRVVLAAHYFGFPQKIQEFRELCQRKSLLLFEDCAHVLRTEHQGQPLGSFGDASVFSYRKFLPMFDGAELLLPKIYKYFSPNWQRERSRFNLHAAKFIVGQAVDSSANPAARILLRGVEAAKKFRGRKKTAATGTPPTEQMVDNNCASFDLALVNQPITLPSSWVLRQSDVITVADRRRANFLFLQNGFQNIAGVTPLFRELGQGVCPWVYPLFMDGVPNAHLLLRGAGIPAVTWGGVRAIEVSEREFPEANFLYDNLIFLPLHQDLSRDHLQMIVETVKKVRAETRELLPQKVFATG
jgi:hypothetical protein